MIPADLGAELTRAISQAVAAGELPPAAVGVRPAGTWRPAPGGGDAGYATSLPFELARLAGVEPVAIAARLAGALRGADWISAAEPTGGGYLTVAVTPAALAGLAVRIAEAGPYCARSTALRGITRPLPPLPDLAAALSWTRAWRDQAAALTGRLACAAGAAPEKHESKRDGPHRGPGTEPGLADAVAYAGVDAVRYRLARARTETASGIEPRDLVTGDLTDSYYAVRFAHADAASTLRWAADLGLARGARELAGQLGQPAEIALLRQLSWLAERVAGAARRSRPAELPRYLEQTARAWLDCREDCPALPFGGRAAPRSAAGISARLGLADATRTVLATGLELIGITPGDRRWSGCPSTAGL